MKIVMLSVNDWANVGGVYQECFRRVGLDAVSLCSVKHRFNYPNLGPDRVLELNPSDPIKVWIDDFIKSKDPRFEGDSKKQRIQRAIASWYSARREAGLKTEDSEEELTELFLEKNSDVYRWDDVNSVMTKLNVSPKEITRALVSLSPGKKDRHTWEELNSAFMHAGFKIPTILKILDKLKFYTLKEEMKDSEFDKIMVAIMNSPVSEKFLDAVEAKNESAVRNLVKSQVKDASKIDEVVYRVMRG